MWYFKLNGDAQNWKTSSNDRQELYASAECFNYQFFYLNTFTRFRNMSVTPVILSGVVVMISEYCSPRLLPTLRTNGKLTRLTKRITNTEEEGRRLVRREESHTCIPFFAPHPPPRQSVHRHAFKAWGPNEPIQTGVRVRCHVRHVS